MVYLSLYFRLNRNLNLGNISYLHFTLTAIMYVKTATKFLSAMVYGRVRLVWWWGGGAVDLQHST